MIDVHMLWVNGSLSQIEVLSCKSFLKNGYNVNLWTYEPVKNIPEGVVVRDASTVIPREDLFLVKGSYANFSDWFRYAVLAKHPGMWSDIDVIALRPASELPKREFFVTEDLWEGSFRQDRDYVINGNLIYYPEHYSGSVIDLALVVAERMPKEKLQWTEIGPHLLHNLIEIYPDKDKFDIKPVAFANSVAAGVVAEQVTAPGEVDPNAWFLHLYNDMWRRSGIDKNAPFPDDSIIGKLSKQYA